MWYKYSQDDTVDLVLESEKYYNELAQEELNHIMKWETRPADILISLPKKYWPKVNYPSVKELLRIHWYDPETKQLIPRKISFADEDKIVLSPMWKYGSYLIKHEDEALVSSDLLESFEYTHGIKLL